MEAQANNEEWNEISLGKLVQIIMYSVNYSTLFNPGFKCEIKISLCLIKTMGLNLISLFMRNIAC